MWWEVSQPSIGWLCNVFHTIPKDSHKDTPLMSIVMLALHHWHIPILGFSSLWASYSSSFPGFTRIAFNLMSALKILILDCGFRRSPSMAMTPGLALKNKQRNNSNNNNTHTKKTPQIFGMCIWHWYLLLRWPGHDCVLLSRFYKAIVDCIISILGYTGWWAGDKAVDVVGRLIASARALASEHEQGVVSINKIELYGIHKLVQIPLKIHTGSGYP